MKHFSKKVLTVLIAAALAVNGAWIGTLSSAAADSVKYELETGTVSGGTVKEDSGASNGSYVFFENGGEQATVTIPVETTGLYDIYVGYSSPYGDKIEYLTVNGSNQGSVSFPETAKDIWTELNAGTTKLSAGDNEIGVQCSWGWVNVDYIRIEAATLPEISASDTTCSDVEATAATQKLMEYLSSVYGKNVISGQQEYYGSSRETEFDYIEELTGELPVIRGFDFGDTCPLYAWDDGATNRIINWVNTEGGIATASWHINVPTTMANYTLGSTMNFTDTTYSEKTDFVTANVMVEGTTEYEYFLLAVDNLAKELQKIQDAGVPLLFRPFHEAEGNGGADGKGAWFWWAKEGSETYVELYQYLHDILVNKYGLHNLIWEFNSYNYSSDSASFYPGADYVDIIGYDKYNATNWSTGVTSPNESAISSTFYGLMTMYNNTKMIAMMENDTIPSVENIVDESAYWLYFMPWYGDHLMNTNYNNKETLTELYQSDLVITLDEFKEAYAAFQPSGTTVTRETTTSTSKTTTTTDPTATTTTGVKEFELVKYQLTDLTPGKTLTINLEGTPNASTNGCFGYVDENDPDASATGWVSKEWKGQYDSDGKLTITFTVPDSVTAGEFQIWWAGLWDEATEENVYADSAMIDYSCEDAKTTTSTEDVTTTTTTDTTAAVSSETTTQTTTTAEGATTTTVSEVVEPSLYGDVNMDGKVDLTDAILLNKAVANQVKLSDTALANADCTLDQELNGNDSIALLRFLVHLNDSLPVTQ